MPADINMFTVVVSRNDEIAVRSCLRLCLQRQVAKLASGLLYCWSLLRNNNTAINLQTFTSSWVVGVFPRVTKAPLRVFSTQNRFLRRAACLGLIMKIALNLFFFEVKIHQQLQCVQYYKDNFISRHVRKYAYRMKQNVFKRFHILI